MTSNSSNTNNNSSNDDRVFHEDGISLTRSPDGLFTLLLNRTENRFNPTMNALLDQALLRVEQASHPKALIITAGNSNKFFSNGLDLDWMMKQQPPHSNNNSSSSNNNTQIMIESLWKLLARILILDCRTVAAINGHAFGAGFFLALCCDYRIMRTQRGYLNFPELNLGMPLSVGFAAIVKTKIPDMRLQREAVLTGKRYDSAQAFRVGIVDSQVAMEELQDAANQLAREGYAESLRLSNFDPKSFSQLKLELYSDAYYALTKGKASASFGGTATRSKL